MEILRPCYARRRMTEDELPRNTEGLTSRQRQSQQIMRDKNARKKRKAILRRVTFVAGGVLAVTLAGGGVWLWKSNTASRSVQTAVDGAYGLTVKAGFAVQSLYLEGRNRTTMDDINKALGVKKGDPILRLSIAEIRQRLEKIESIKLAAVERELPGTLYIRIVEREPVARWQNHNKTALVDDNGVVMNGIDMTPYQKLPLIIGDNAPTHVRELMAILAAEPELARHFSAAILVSDRRWNIRLSGSAGSDVEIRLPETNPEEAWKRLADAEIHQQVLDRDVKVIDLRLEGKMFIKVIPEEAHPKTGNARET